MRADDTPNDPPVWIDRTILALLIALLVFMAAAFGAVERWSELVAFAIASIIALLLAVRTLIVGGRTPPSWRILLPVSIFILLALAQLMPLPQMIARILSPRTVRTKIELLRDVPGSDAILNRI